MKKTVGISIYPNRCGEKETIKYIKEAYECGIRNIFSSLLEIQSNKEGRKIIEMFTRVFKVAKDLGYEIILDVAPEVHKELKLKNTELLFFKNMNATGLRLDESFSPNIMSQLTNNDYDMKIQLNASGSTKIIDDLISAKGNKNNILVCHNFYPLKYTGIAYKEFLYLSNYYNKLNIKVAAFVTLPESQQGIGVWDVNNGMPTIEAHRYALIDDQVRHLLATNFISNIIISQQRATKKQLFNIKKILNNKVDLIFKMEDIQKYLK